MSVFKITAGQTYRWEGSESYFHILQIIDVKEDKDISMYGAILVLTYEVESDGQKRYAVWDIDELMNEIFNGEIVLEGERNVK